MMREENKSLYDTFGSVQVAMLTLFKTSMGGQDWEVFYDVAEQTGIFEAITFIIFVAFIQIALMNILTGIFVENAMKLAQPDRDTLAFQFRKQRMQDAQDLK